MEKIKILSLPTKHIKIWAFEDLSRSPHIMKSGYIIKYKGSTFESLDDDHFYRDMESIGEYEAKLADAILSLNVF